MQNSIILLRDAPREWVAANGEVLARLRRRSVELLPESAAQALSNMVHGAAVLGFRAGDELFRVAAQAAVGSRLRGFEAQGISNTVWAFATAGHAAPPLFDEAAAAAVARIRDFGPCLLYTSPSPRDRQKSRMPSSA